MAVSAIITTAVIGAATTVYGVVQQRSAAKDAAKAQKKANRAREGQAAIENRARRAKIIRQRQLASAQAEGVQAGGAGAGVTSSMATGALATSTTQGTVNLANFAEQGRQGSILASANLALGRAQSRANFGKSLTQLGGTLMSNAQRIGGMTNMFTQSPTANLGGFLGTGGNPGSIDRAG